MAVISQPQIKAIQHESYWTLTILGLVIPVVGIIIGAVYMTKENKLERKLGEHVLSISILFAILESIAWMAFVLVQTPALTN